MGKIIRIDSLHFGNRKSCSANGNGVRICVWFLGCDINCDGCHNKDYWDFDNPNFEDFSDKHIEMIIDEMSEYSDIYSGISILGGEPFSKRNIKDAITLCDVAISYGINKYIGNTTMNDKKESLLKKLNRGE